MQVVLISKFFLSPKSVDSTSSIQMIKSLKKINPQIRIHVVTSEDTYKNNSEKGGTDLDQVDQIHIVKSLNLGSKGILLLLGTLIGGLRLVLKARALSISNVISLTNPPLISLWCALLLRNRNWAYWSFDLYPDALAASDILPENNLIYKMIDLIVYKFPPSFLICLGEKQRDYLFNKYKTELPYAILPCGIISHPVPDKNELPSWYDSDRKYFGYIGNVGKAHSKEFITEAIRNVKLLADFTLILAIYGDHKEEIEKFAKELNSANIHLLDSVPAYHLSLIDIHLVSLLPSWTHISVPSKAVSAICSGSTICYYGKEETDTWQMFQNCGFYVKDLTDIPSVLSSITSEKVESKKANARELYIELVQREQNSFQIIYDIFLNAGFKQ